MERKITHLDINGKKFNVGTNGVKTIGVDFIPDIPHPVCSVDYGDKIMSFVGNVNWTHKEDLIAIPKIVLDGDAS